MARSQILIAEWGMVRVQRNTVSIILYLQEIGSPPWIRTTVHSQAAPICESGAASRDAYPTLGRPSFWGRVCEANGQQLADPPWPTRKGYFGGGYMLEP